jgi:hypothetical protein
MPFEKFEHIVEIVHDPLIKSAPELIEFISDQIDVRILKKYPARKRNKERKWTLISTEKGKTVYGVYYVPYIVNAAMLQALNEEDAIEE